MIINQEFRHREKRVEIMNNWKRTSKGFTIVELLIVIFVIGILAAITIVAYNNIQTRGRLSAYQADVTLLLKKAEAYYSLVGSHALTAAPGVPDTGATACQSTNGANLTTTLNSQSESRLGSGLGICGVVLAAGTPTYAQATTAATNATAHYYYVQYCATGRGMYIFYPDPTTSTVLSKNSGVCP
jgi:prepilin-type N-terminal cleavage/methylation domain-containing protein